MLLLSLTWLTCLPILSYALSLATRENAYDFRRRAGQSLVVLGDYLYMQGGEIVLYDNGEPSSGKLGGLESTLSIPITSSWTDAMVEVKNITPPRNTGAMKDTIFWADESTNKLYRWAGQKVNDERMASSGSVLYIFTPDGEGDGSWTSQPPANPPVFEDIYGVAGAAFGACGGQGIAVGGHAFEATDQRLENLSSPILIPGVVSFNFSTHQWANESAAPVNSPTGTLDLASGVCLPDVGPDPLFITLGGVKTADNSTTEDDYSSFSNITFFNVESRTWHWQEATGDVPSGRRRFCAAGVQGQDGTYEIFIHGGLDSSQTLNDTYVLSLPGFQWFQVDAESTPRHSHGCAATSNGQVIIAGGLASDGDNRWLDQDPWKKGLGVFNLAALEWSEGYNADAPRYETPQVIREWYSQRDAEPVEWSSDEVRAMFTREEDPASTPPPEVGDNEPSSSGPPVGAIAGGVVGGVAGLALIGALVFFLMRRRRQKTEPSELMGNSMSPKSPADQSMLKPDPPSELSDQPRSELDGQTRQAEASPVELPTEANQRHEAPG